MLFLKVVAGFFDALLFYPRWFLPRGWFFRQFDAAGKLLPLRDMPRRYEWTERAIITAPTLAVAAILAAFLLGMGIYGKPFGHEPFLWFRNAYLGFGVWFVLRSYGPVIVDYIVAGYDTIVDGVESHHN